MWAQLIKSRVKPGKENELRLLQEEIASRSRESGYGGIRAINLQSQSDPSEYYTLVIFESEAVARERERSPEQEETVRRIRECMDGMPKYTDLNVISEMSS